jgi:3-deoxy-D-manno-octulosonic-acid transferase
VEPLAEALQKRFPNARLIFSTVTQTGQAMAKERFAKYGADNTFYFPFDLAGIADRVLDWLRPSVLIIIDTEIWPNVLRQCAGRGIPVVLANGRISPKSFRWYRWLQPLLAPVLADYSALLAQSEVDAQRLQSMGARRSRVIVTGNIKYDRDPLEAGVGEAKADALDRAFGLTADPAALIVAGSTHEGEEQILLDAFRRLRFASGQASARLMLAPRHPERFEQVASLAERNGFHVSRRSNGGSGAGPCEVLLLDTMGELATAYRFAAVVFVGGSLVPIGGHSIIEPAAYGKPIVVGPYMRNSPGIIDDFLSCGALVQISADESRRDRQCDELVDAFTNLLTDAVARAKMGQAASDIFARSKGATRTTADHIARILQDTLGVGD